MCMRQVLYETVFREYEKGCNQFIFLGGGASVFFCPIVRFFFAFYKLTLQRFIYFREISGPCAPLATRGKRFFFAQND